jgi:photosynthetic reaction center cytochrome c subunit
MQDSACRTLAVLFDRVSRGAVARGRKAGGLVLAAALVLAALPLAGCERTETVQRGFRGTGMYQFYSPATLARAVDVNQIPEPEPVDPPDPEAPPLKEVFSNVQVLNDLTVLEFSRLMQAMSTWIAPEEGCDFCHNADYLESDEKYTKVAARRMLQMTRDINIKWKSHVGDTGVTCWTCHRGQAVPSGDWFANPGPRAGSIALGYKAGQNVPNVHANGMTSLPYDPLSMYLAGDDEIRVQSDTALRNGNERRIKDAEASYALMMYMSNSLGVNCTYCHSTRALARWDQSSPQRATAWHGIRMVRDINNNYLTPLTSLFPDHRLSPEGDGPKVGCETCHKGSFKPLLGVSMLPDYPELAGPLRDPPEDTPPAKQAAGPGASEATKK